MPVLLIDIGNSRVKWRMVDPRSADGEEAKDFGESDAVSIDDLSQLAQRFDESREPMLDAAYLSNVAGARVEGAVRNAVLARWGDVAIHSLIPGAAQCGVDNGYRDPAQLGPDRWAALLGAHALLPGQHLLVCNFGTATTIDLLLRQGREGKRALFAGGLILPGFEAMRRALARDTARLPLAQGEVVEFATRTDDAIASGIVAALAGAVTRALDHARKRAVRDALGSNRDFSCVLAGGDAKTIAAHLSEVPVPIKIVPDLVLRGLYAVACDTRQNDEPRRAESPLVRERS